MFMMEVNMMNPEHTAPHARYTINLFMIAYYGIRGTLWFYTAQYLLVRQREKQLLLVF